MFCINYQSVGDVKIELHNILRACYTSTISFTEKKILVFFKESVYKLGEREGGVFMDSL